MEYASDKMFNISWKSMRAEDTGETVKRCECKRRSIVPKWFMRRANNVLNTILRFSNWFSEFNWRGNSTEPNQTIPSRAEPSRAESSRTFPSHVNELPQCTQSKQFDRTSSECPFPCSSYIIAVSERLIIFYLLFFSLLNGGRKGYVIFQRGNTTDLNEIVQRPLKKTINHERKGLFLYNLFCCCCQFQRVWAREKSELEEKTTN